MIRSKLRNALSYFLKNRQKYISNRNFIMLVALIVGICGGLAAVLLKMAVYYVRYILTVSINYHYRNYFFFVFPLVGILLTVLYKVFVLKKYKINGLGNLLFTISRQSSNIERHETYSNIIGSSLTVGFGGSVGLETPIVTTGAAIGSYLGRIFRFGYKKRTLLIACGVAAGIGGIFNAPIAGMVFTLEVLLFEFNVPAFVPILISAVTGTIVSKYFLGEEILFSSAVPDAFSIKEIPYYVLLGIVTGFTSFYFLKLMDNTREGLIKKIPNKITRAIWGSVFLGILIFLFPPLYGEGYISLKEMLSGNASKLFDNNFLLSGIHDERILLIFVLAMVFLKVIASALTIGAGGNGGVFAPSIFSGGLSGYFVAKAINMSGILPFNLSEKNFMLVGMAGLISGVFHAPLTALFLIAEITGGYTLILPLMTVSAIAYATSAFFEPNSVYLKQLERKGHIFTRDKDKTVLTLLKLKTLVETDFSPLPMEGHLKDIVEAVANSKRDVYPVLNTEGQLMGIINLNDIKHIMFKPELYDNVSIQSLMHLPKDRVSINESMEDVMDKFDRSGEWNLPVSNETGRFIGLISKSKIFSGYRELLKRQAKEDIEIIE